MSIHPSDCQTPEGCVILKVPKAKAKQMAADILTKLPVDDILINEVEIDDVIRHIFQLQKK